MDTPPEPSPRPPTILSGEPPESSESKVRLFGVELSFRGVLALVLMLTLCALTWQHPDLFSKAFESIAIAVVAFYFGQSKK